MTDKIQSQTVRRVQNSENRPRVGVPYRTVKEQDIGELRKFDKYLKAIQAVGGEPVPISLRLNTEELESRMQTLDAVVLTGSPADWDPTRYHAQRHPKSADPDALREWTDHQLLKHAFREHKPVLAICYGVQSLNVYRDGTLVQDIPSELSTQIGHSRKGLPPDADDPVHPAKLEADSRLAQLAGATEIQINSSHHQCIRDPGRGLRVVAHAPDGVIEAVEWEGDSDWVMGVQWHPERMTEDSLAQALFRELVAVARGTHAKI